MEIILLCLVAGYRLVEWIVKKRAASSKRPFLRFNQVTPAYFLSAGQLYYEPSCGLPDAGVEGMCVSGLFLAFFLDLGFGHGQANTFKQFKDGKAVPQGVQHVENQHANHQ